MASARAPAIAVFLSLLVVVNGAEARFLSNNITVVGSVYCDACSNDTSSKRSFFLQGARVLIQCSFKVNSSAAEELALEAERTTDRNGVYKLDVPPVDGLACREGHELRSACRATLLRSASVACDVPGLRGSTQHVALRSRATNACFLNLNALNFRPAKADTNLCGGGGSPLFFWPLWPLFLPPFGFPLPLPQWLVPFLRLPFWPFPLHDAASDSAAPPPPI